MTIRDDLTERYEKDIELMQKMYLEAERQFIEFNLIVPYADNDDEVYSPRLVSLLQIIGSQIDGVLNILAGLMSIKLKNPDFTDYMRVLDRYNLLTVQQIQFKENRKILTPFEFNHNHTTDWRIALNDTKHKLPRGAYSGRYGHVVNSLAALAILNEVVVRATYARFRPYVLNSKNWSEDGLRLRQSGLIVDHDFCREKSQVFNYVMWFSLVEPAPIEPTRQSP